MNKCLKTLLFLFCVLILAVCQSQKIQKPQETESKDFAEMRPGNRNLDELTVAFTSQEMELDFRKSVFSSEAQIYTALYEGLFSYHPLSLEPVPALAEKWSLSENKLQWTFTLRRNARFSNGDPIRAEDFRAAWISVLAPGTDYPYSSFFDVIEGAKDYRNGVLKDQNKIGIQALDQRTLVIKLNTPASFFPAMLCHHSFSPIHPSMLKKTDWSPFKDGKNWTPPVTNGPFQIVSMNAENIVMQKSENYWDSKRVVLNKLFIKFTENADKAAHLWNSGEARWISGDVNLDLLTDRSGIQVNVMFGTHYYYVRSSEKPWNDYRVRRAMILVLPWSEIRSNYFLPAETLIFPVAGYPTVEGISEANYEEALKLMDEAGYKDTTGMPVLVIRITPGRDAERVGSLMANAWKEKLGLNVRVEVIPFNRYFQSMKESGYTVGSITWIGDFADPYAFLQMFRRDSTLNDAHLDDPDYEELIERSMVEEGKTRLETLSKAEKLLLDRGVVLPIFFNPALNIIDTGELDGWYPNAMDIHPFKYLAFKGFRPLPGVALIK
jgi:oligopeptide transport system substrate-binding protein